MLNHLPNNLIKLKWTLNKNLKFYLKVVSLFGIHYAVSLFYFWFCASCYFTSLYNTWLLLFHSSKKGQNLKVINLWKLHKLFIHKIQTLLEWQGTNIAQHTIKKLIVKYKKVFENIMEQNINDWVKIYSHYILHQFLFDYVSLKVPILNLCTFSIITLK